MVLLKSIVLLSTHPFLACFNIVWKYAIHHLWTSTLYWFILHKVLRYVNRYNLSTSALRWPLIQTLLDVFVVLLAIDKIHIVPQRAMECGPGLGGVKPVYGIHITQSWQSVLRSWQTMSVICILLVKILPVNRMLHPSRQNTSNHLLLS